MTTPVDETKLEPEVEPDEPEDGYNELPKVKINIKNSSCAWRHEDLNLVAFDHLKHRYTLQNLIDTLANKALKESWNQTF